ncbi:auxilin-like clathrin-binding protein required for normal clathrin function [Tilletia horrida]|nr:auxilin-like clathrin-binding protein required for normal clathrin function [Tilletia horrida]
MDDLLDLDWGSGGGAKPKQPSLTLAQQQQQQQQQQQIAHQLSASTYNFDALTRSLPSASGSPYASSRAGTPSLLPTHGAGTGAGSKPTAAPTNSLGGAKAPTSNSASASFADLVNFGGGSSSGTPRAGMGVGTNGTSSTAGGAGKGTAGMSMLERAQAQAQAQAGGRTTAQTSAADAQLWDFDAFSSATSSAGSAVPALPARTPARADGLKTSTSSAPKVVPTSSSNRDIFALLGEDNPSASAPREEAPALPKRSGNGHTPASASSGPKDPFDFDAFDATQQTSGGSVPNVSIGRADGHDEDEDDFLGALGKPVEPKPKPQPQPAHRDEADDRLRADAPPASPGFGEGSSTSSRAPSPADGGRRRYQERYSSSSSSSAGPNSATTGKPLTAGPRRAGRTFEDEERAARERDDAILGGAPSSSSTSSVATSLFGANNEDNLLGALGRSLGFGGKGSAPQTPPSGPGRLRADAQRGGHDGASTPGSVSSRAPSPATGGRSRYQDRAARRARPGAEDGDDDDDGGAYDRTARDDAILGGESSARRRDQRQQPHGPSQLSQLSAAAANLWKQGTSAAVGGGGDGEETNLFGALGKAVKSALGVPADGQDGEDHHRRSPAPGSGRGTRGGSALDRLRAEGGGGGGGGSRSSRGGSRVASPGPGSAGLGGYSDGPDGPEEDEEPRKPAPEAERRLKNKSSAQALPGARAAQPEADLFRDSADSESARAPAPRASRRAPVSSSGGAATPRRPDPVRVPRSIVSDSGGAISASAGLKAQGNDAFRRGAYGEAETQYGKALDVLEEGSLRRIPLLNNRAQARLKNGEAAGASRDCDAVLAIIVPPTKASSSSAGSSSTGVTLYRPREETALPEPLASEVNLRDAWAKAVLRRAQACEMLERWVSARRDWDALLRFEKEEGSGKAGVANMRSAKEGLARCEEMISGKGKKAAAKPSSGTGAASSAARTSAAASGGSMRQSASTAAAIARAGEAGVARVREEAAAQAAEDAAKLSLKDQVDAAVSGWKDGKESNVRGLLASVESVVVWPEFGWKKIGMHELITDGQVKKAYTRAIARLHPDKLSSKNTTLEQRMVAAAVFAALNEAFTASQA